MTSGTGDGMHLGILGGGLSGIALQRYVRCSSEVLEKEPTPGGLCRTTWTRDFGWDVGGHILFSKDAAINALVDGLLGDNKHLRRRANRILYRGRWVKYPFENDLAALGKEEAFDCLIGYLNAGGPPPSNLEEWAHWAFGTGIADRYLLPYNRKIWKTEPAEMGLDWIARVPRPPLEDVVKSALGIETEGATHQLFFRYPSSGGAEALVHALRHAEKPLTCNAAVRSIRRSGPGWEVSSDAGDRHFDRIVVAFPVHEAIRCLDAVPDLVLQAVASLRYTSIRVVLVAVDEESLLDKSAAYIPDPTVLAHRVCYPGFFSPSMVRPGTSSLVAEVTSRPGDSTDRLSDDEVVSRTVSDLDRVGILDRRHVVLTDLRRFEYAYPIHDLTYGRNVAIVRKYFASLGIDLLGRFAEFEYVNSDECLRRALRLAERING